jgi:hypothetical protein
VRVRTVVQYALFETTMLLFQLFVTVKVGTAVGNELTKIFLDIAMVVEGVM